MKTNNDSIFWWNYVRDEELKPVLDIFSKHKNLKILEIGGGNGYQAKKISDLGYSIKSIDILSYDHMYYNVEKFDARQLPFPDNSFNVILTSLVLQHIENIDLAFKEMNRVISDDGIIIHVIPTSWWTLFTNFWHFYQFPKFLIKSISKRTLTKSTIQNTTQINIKKNNTSKIKQLILNPLDQNDSFIHDIYFFSQHNWKKLFKKNSYNIIQIKKCPISSSGYGILKNRFHNLRKIFSQIFPTTICIVLNKTQNKN